MIESSYYRLVKQTCKYQTCLFGVYETQLFTPFARVLVKLVPATVATDASLANQLVCTLPETNIAPENGWLEDYFPIWEAYFLEGELIVAGRVS